LQLEGKENIDKIAFAVDAGVEVFEKAKQINADMLVVHHGIFWDRIDPRLVGVNKKRLDILLSANINLYAAHLPLDMHDKVGNNVSLVKMIGAEPAGRFWNYNGNFIAALGKFPLPQKTSQLAQIIEDKLKTKVHVLGEDKEVLTLAAASGGVSLDAINEAKAVGADLLIVGEMRDFYHLAKDSDISVIFAGHHASEQAGIWALQKHVAKEFPDLECVYIECPTGL
jgi:dinuclear metal center YbgI/SA1388 family protein